MLKCDEPLANKSEMTLLASDTRERTVDVVVGHPELGRIPRGTTATSLYNNSANQTPFLTRQQRSSLVKVYVEGGCIPNGPRDLQKQRVAGPMITATRVAYKTMVAKDRTTLGRCWATKRA